MTGDHCPLEWVTECQVKVPEGESVGGWSNICSSPTEFFPLQSLKVLHYSGTVLESLRVACLEMSVNCQISRYAAVTIW